MTPMRLWTSFAVLFVLFTLSAHGSVVITLSTPVFPTTPVDPNSTKTMLVSLQLDYTVSASPLPTPAVNGLTKYEEIKYFTRLVAVYNKTTSVTLLSTPTPVHTCDYRFCLVSFLVD